ncbi:MAG: hypothetical protein M3168_01405 [Actinomycetota bacterium]|nr:hypothetical protein [Actinomycetota bacterium]
MKRFILVAGVDYERKGVDFRIFCNSRMKRIVAANRAQEGLSFQIFDVKAGEVVTHEFTYPGGERAESVSKTKPFDAVTRSHYRNDGTRTDPHYVFNDGQTGMMSVTDVYAAARSIGATDPGTLFELSFFSHAWFGGPILVNSNDDGFITGPPSTSGGPPTRTATGAARDPDDKDPRPKDFVPPNMSAAELQLFQDAYRADGYSWSWGCAFPRQVHEILHKLEHHRDYRSSGLADDQIFVFTNFRAEHVGPLQAFLGVVFPDPKSVELEFKELKRFFCKVTEGSYTHHLAVHSQKKTFGGVMGTYSEYDTGRLPLMHVEKSFTRHFKFYESYLGFKFDPEGRRYGEFSPMFSC